MLDDRLVTRILSERERLRDAGRLKPPELLNRYYSTFREKLGPSVLAGLDGEALLKTLHLQSDHSSLVYWLEFKNDEELPDTFGSIFGGSALKYEVYFSTERQSWATGTSRAIKDIPLNEAIRVGQRHRDELLAAVQAIESASDSIGGQELQALIATAAPSIHDSAWAHKYLHMLLPDKIEPLHVEYYQRFYLLKLLQEVPEEGGRYICAPVYRAAAEELRMPMIHLVGTLLDVFGRPHGYWRIGTTSGDSADESYWPVMKAKGMIAVGWSKLGALHDIGGDQLAKETLRSRLASNYTYDAPLLGRQTNQLFSFLHRVAPGDVVLACNGARVLGIGRVTGDYAYDGEFGHPHTKAVEWDVLTEWILPTQEGLRTTVAPIRKSDNLLEVERRLLAPSPGGVGKPPPPGPPALPPFSKRVADILERKRQVILYGPPGTGKTYWALRTSFDLAAIDRYGRLFNDLHSEDQTALKSSGVIQSCTFHPSYGYEDFLEGFRPLVKDGVAGFDRQDGLFKQLCKKAAADREHKYYLVIDEINRGDVPRIFGELLTVLEGDKRGMPVVLALSGEAFTVPDNLYLLATMNTADRSISLLDAAVRRRFGFVELLPNTGLLSSTIEGLPLGPWLRGLNARLLQHGGRDARNRQVGHSFFLEAGAPITEVHKFVRVVREEIVPLLEEYCYEDYERLAAILGDIVDVNGQRVNEDLFETARWPELLDALRRVDPALLTSPEAVATSTTGDAEDDGLEETEAAPSSG